MTDSLPSLATTFLAADEPESWRCAFSALTAALKAAIRDGRHADAAVSLRLAINPALDLTTAQSLYRFRKSLRSQVKTSSCVRLAVLSNSTLDHLTSAH